MEGAPKMEQGRGIEEELELVEVGDGWWQLKEVAPTQAEELIAGIEGFEHMGADEQLRALQGLLITLASAGNENRYLAEEIAKRMTVMKAANAYQATADAIPQVPTGRVLTEA